MIVRISSATGRTRQYRKRLLWPGRRRPGHPAPSAAHKRRTVAAPRAYSPTRPRESTGCTAGRERVVLVLEASPQSREESQDPPHTSCNMLGEIVNISRVRICPDSLKK